MIAPLQRTLIKAAVATVLFIPAIAAAVIGYRTQRRMEERLRGEAEADGTLPAEPATNCQPPEQEMADRRLEG